MKIPNVRFEDIMKPPPPLTKEQFLRQLNLVPVSNSPPQPSTSQSDEFLNIINIPLSSERGKTWLEKENYQVPDDLINKGLEKVVPSTSKSSKPNKPIHRRKYKFPKRQQHQMKNYHKMLKFCRPLSVALEYCDLHKLKEKYEKELKENASKELEGQPKELTENEEKKIL